MKKPLLEGGGKKSRGLNKCEKPVLFYICTHLAKLSIVVTTYFCKNVLDYAPHKSKHIPLLYRH
jgi:hypothetical protein